jgi:hypothetical protein
VVVVSLTTQDRTLCTFVRPHNRTHSTTHYMCVLCVRWVVRWDVRGL